jgi:hypothetical protein
MIAGKAAGLIDNLPDHAQQSAIMNGKPFYPSAKNHAIYAPLIEKYIQLEETLNEFYQS